MCWSAENGYCWTRQVSHISSARRKLRELSSAIRCASSGGKFKLSLRHTCCSTCTICKPHTSLNMKLFMQPIQSNIIINTLTTSDILSFLLSAANTKSHSRQRPDEEKLHTALCPTGTRNANISKILLKVNKWYTVHKHYIKCLPRFSA